MATSLTCTGIVWAALSLVSAAVACAGFYLPFWIKGSLPLMDPLSEQTSTSTVDTYFGSFRRCNYPRVSETGAIEVVLECGRYTAFADIPSVSWQICTVVVGLGCGLALLVGFTACMACCMADVINKATARAAGIVQLVAALLIVVGCAIYPNGWHSAEVREACGGRSEAFVLGTCSLSWSFYVLGASVVVILICVALSFKASRVKCGSYRI